MLLTTIMMHMTPKKTNKEVYLETKETMDFKEGPFTKYVVYVVTGPTGDAMPIETDDTVNNPLFVANIMDVKAMDSPQRRAKVANDIVMPEYESQAKWTFS